MVYPSKLSTFNSFIRPDRVTRILPGAVASPTTAANIIEAIRSLEKELFLTRREVIENYSGTNTDAPTGVTTGARYITGPDSVTGADPWDNQDEVIAEWTGSEWSFVTPAVGMLIYVAGSGAGTYRYDGTTWVVTASGSSGVNNNFAATTNPTIDDDVDQISPGPYVVGSHWVNVTLDTVYVCVDSTNGAAVWQQVDAGAGGGGGASIDSQDNLIVNPCMQLSEEEGDTLLTVSGEYPADQWTVGAVSDGGTFSLQRVQVRTPSGATDRLRLTITTADAVLEATSDLYIYQALEGSRLVGANFGLATASSLIVRIGLNCPEGVVSVSFTNNVDRYFVQDITISAGEAGTDVVKEVIVPGDVTGTWNTGNVRGMYMRIAFASGSSGQGVAGSWGASNIRGTANTSNGWAALNVFEVFDIGMRIDSNDVGSYGEFIVPDVIFNTETCQRYFEKGSSSIRDYASAASQVSLSSMLFATKKRISPSIANTTNTSINTTANIFTDVTSAGFSHHISSTAIGRYSSESQIFHANARM